MKRLTEQDIEMINEINGTAADRYEYFEKLANVLGGDYGRHAWAFKNVACVRFADGTILDIETKKVKGSKIISYIRVWSGNSPFIIEGGTDTKGFEAWEYKKGTFVRK